VRETAIPYLVTCDCGAVLRGQRRPHHQIALCPGCGRKHFILPISPWPACGSTPSLRGTASYLHPARFLLVIVAGGIAAAGLIFLAVKPYLRHTEPAASSQPPGRDLRGRITAGRRALAEGNVRLASQALAAALEEHARNPTALDREEFHHLRQLHRQSDLLARLLDRSLEEILQQGLHHRDDEEWHAKFADYRGRSVVFDDVLRRDASGRPILASYVVQVGEVKAQLALEDLFLLRQLPLDLPQRWLFGACLAICRREEGGVWVIRFEPDSAVLLTDEEAAAACCPGPLDAELRGVLERQQEWLRR
jgi:hypothetical protein